VYEENKEERSNMDDVPSIPFEDYKAGQLSAPESRDSSLGNYEMYFTSENASMCGASESKNSNQGIYGMYFTSENALINEHSNPEGSERVSVPDDSKGAEEISVSDQENPVCGEMCYTFVSATEDKKGTGQPDSEKTMDQQNAASVNSEGYNKSKMTKNSAESKKLEDMNAVPIYLQKDLELEDIKAVPIHPQKNLYASASHECGKNYNLVNMRGENSFPSSKDRKEKMDEKIFAAVDVGGTAGGTKCDNIIAKFRKPRYKT